MLTRFGRAVTVTLRPDETGLLHWCLPSRIPSASDAVDIAPIGEESHVAERAAALLDAAGRAARQALTGGNPPRLPARTP